MRMTLEVMPWLDAVAASAFTPKGRKKSCRSTCTHAVHTTALSNMM